MLENGLELLRLKETFPGVIFLQHGMCGFTNSLPP
jgi:hypothetical protein